jgi:hypothetical protein
MELRKVGNENKTNFVKNISKKGSECGHTIGRLNSRRIWRNPAACKLQDDIHGQKALMQCDRWEKRWSYEKLEMKTKQIFGKTFHNNGRGGECHTLHLSRSRSWVEP